MATTTPTPSAAARLALHEVLRLWEPAAGPKGFEGLVAHALAEATGLTFRLARSGAQFGRDAATPNAPFSIAMEAKRYKERGRGAGRRHRPLGVGGNRGGQ